MINFFKKNKIPIGVCISGHLDYKIRGRKELKLFLKIKMILKIFTQ